MRTFTASELDTKAADIIDAANESPVILMQDDEPQLVVMSYEHYRLLERGPDPRRAFKIGEAPAGLGPIFAAELARTARGEGYDDEKGAFGLWGSGPDGLVYQRTLRREW